MKSLIYGYGKTGKSFERFLIKKKLKYDIFDNNISEFYVEYDLKKYSQILCSPGIPKNQFKKINSQNKNVFTDLDIFFKEDNSIKIGITGTNRKSTTAYHLFQLFEYFEPANLIGNIGNPMLDAINNRKYSIIELSSFQLDKMIENKLDFGILLNLDIDHLDYHGNEQSYKQSKRKILLAKKNISYETNPYKLFEWVTGRIPKKIIFKDLPYRYERIARNIINDSKSTNFHSLNYALKNANNEFGIKNYVLIICGDPKKENFKKIDVTGPESILIYGDHAERIDKCIQHKNKKFFRSLEEAIKSIKKTGLKTNILFSPGYPSGSDYTDFEQRGYLFNKTIKKFLYED